jgi:hypothetical protein
MNSGISSSGYENFLKDSPEVNQFALLLEKKHKQDQVNSSKRKFFQTKSLVKTESFNIDTFLQHDYGQGPGLNLASEGVEPPVSLLMKQSDEHH